MLGQLPYKTKQFFFVLIKISIVAGAFYFIYRKLTTNENLEFNIFIKFLKANNVLSVKNIVYLLILSCFNWILEILKWQNLVLVIKKISFFEALKQSLASLSASIFTPNRIGEYGVKAAYFTNGYRKRILLLNLLSNMAQMTTTLIFGFVGFTLFYLKYDTNISLYNIARFISLLIVVAVFVILGGKYSKFQIRGFSLEKIISYVFNISYSTHIKTISFSILRYLVFSFQFYFLMRIFGVDVYYYNAMLVISSMYLLSSVIPTIIAFDVIVKGSIALFLFEIVGVNDLTVLSVIMLMWILNIVLPSLVGSFYVLRYDYKKVKTLN